MWLVQEKVRDYGYDPEYSDEHVWLGAEGKKPDAYTEKCLETSYGRLGEGQVGGWCRVHYKDRWQYVQTFFTQDAADAFIRTQAHNYGELRTYVGSGYNNTEWRQIREFLLEQGTQNEC